MINKEDLTPTNEKGQFVKGGKPPRFKKDGTPFVPFFTKGHVPMGNSIKGYAEKKRRDNDAIKIEMDKYTKKIILKNKVALVDALVNRAKQGDVPALREVFDRVVGKAVSPIEMSGKDGQPITVMSFRDFKNKNDNTEEKI